MATAAQPAPIQNGERRRSILDLAPFELDCMNALWPLGEATVKQVQESLMARRPRAYTTIMTILDRLAQKGIVSRRKVGRAYLYRASLQAAEAQQSAVQQLVAGFFGGSREALAAHLHLTGTDAVLPARPVRVERVAAPVAVTADDAKRAAATETEPAAKQSNADSDLDLTLL
jgi:BlaI family penicillinase repressor|nr:BlaI/MecI/CopY family transcriptional regulator [Candidatus Acidoferrales bacterium]